MEKRIGKGRELIESESVVKYFLLALGWAACSVAPGKTKQ